MKETGGHVVLETDIQTYMYDRDRYTYRHVVTEPGGQVAIETDM